MPKRGLLLIFLFLILLPTTLAMEFTARVDGTNLIVTIAPSPQEQYSETLGFLRNNQLVAQTSLDCGSCNQPLTRTINLNRVGISDRQVGNYILTLDYDSPLIEGGDTIETTIRLTEINLNLGASCVNDLGITVSDKQCSLYNAPFFCNNGVLEPRCRSFILTTTLQDGTIRSEPFGGCTCPSGLICQNDGTCQPPTTTTTQAPSCYLTHLDGCSYSPSNIGDNFCAYNCGEHGNLNLPDSACYDPACAPPAKRTATSCTESFSGTCINDQYCGYSNLLINADFKFEDYSLPSFPQWQYENWGRNLNFFQPLINQETSNEELVVDIARIELRNKVRSILPVEDEWFDFWLEGNWDTTRENSHLELVYNVVDKTEGSFIGLIVHRADGGRVREILLPSETGRHHIIIDLDKLKSPFTPCKEASCSSNIATKLNFFIRTEVEDSMIVRVESLKVSNAATSSIYNWQTYRNGAFIDTFIGDKFLKIETSNQNNNYGASQDITVNAPSGTEFTFSGDLFIKSLGRDKYPSGSFMLYLACYYSDGSIADPCAQTYFSDNLIGSWQTHSLTFTTPKQLDRIRAFAIARDPNTQNEGINLDAEAYFANLQLEKKTSSPSIIENCNICGSCSRGEVCGVLGICTSQESILSTNLDDVKLLQAVREQDASICNELSSISKKESLCIPAVAAKRANPNPCQNIVASTARKLCEDNAKAVSCGDGIAQEWEECDSFDFKERTCEDYYQSQGLIGLACTSECKLDFSQCRTERVEREEGNIIQEQLARLRPTSVEKIFSGRLSYNLLDFSSVGGERLGAGTYFTDVYKIHYDAPLQELNNFIGEVTLRWASVDPAISIRQQNTIPLFNMFLTYGTPPSINKANMIELCQFANLPSIIGDSSGPMGGDRSTCFAYLDEEGIHLLAYAYHIKTDTSGRSVNKWFHGRCPNINDCEYRFAYNVYGEATT